MGAKPSLRTAQLFAAATLAACNLDPTDGPVAAVYLSPGSPHLLVGQTAQLTAKLVDALGGVLVGRTIQWETSNQTIATVSTGGLVTAVGSGTATISAASEGRRATTMVSVRQLVEPVARVRISFDSLVLAAGESQILVAIALDHADRSINGLPVTWTSSASQVASVDVAGIVTGVAPGTAIITAIIGGVSASVTVRVPAPMDVAGIWDWTETVSSCSDTGTYVFTQSGTLLRGSYAQVGCPSRAGVSGLVGQGTVNGNGIRFDRDGFDNGTGNSPCHYTGTADAIPPTRISGTMDCGSWPGSGTWEAVRQTAIGEVRIDPPTVSLFAGETQSLAIKLTNTAGRRVFSRPVIWSSSNDAVASVTADGVVRGTGAGSTQITATVEGMRGSTSLTVRTLSFTAVAAGGWSCALTTAGETWCWGQRPGALQAAPVFSSLTMGAASACGLTSDGSAYCWGDNSTGELGVPGGSSETPRAVVGGLHFASLSAGGYVYHVEDYWGSYSVVQAHTCGLTAGGTAYCWGLNSSGQLGSGGPDNSSSPQPVYGGLRFATLSAGGDQTCGLSSAGIAYCWGSNVEGELGSGIGSRSIPTEVIGGLTFKTIAAGMHHTCALTTSGAAYCWGNNGFGQLGIGSFAGTSVPVAVAGGLSFVSIVTGERHTCALTEGGQAYCWGSNESGNLGAGPRGNASAPSPVSLGIAFVALTSGSWAFHTCGITTSSVVYCWGNANGVGGGDIGHADHPVRVLGQP